MGSPFRIRIPKLQPQTIQDLVSCLIKLMLAMAVPLLLLVSWIPIFQKTYDDLSTTEEEEDEEDTDESRPSPSLVQLPVHFMVESIKDQLPVTKYGCLLERLSVVGKCTEEEGGSASCAVCLRCLSASDEIRELCNCSHTFHRECLDGWLDQGQLSCPLCRSKLLPDHVNGEFKSNCERDPWRRERMIYLFGEDCDFGSITQW